MSRLQALKAWLASWFEEIDLVHEPKLEVALRPLMQSWGYENPPERAPNWFSGAKRPFVWIRRRGDYTDEIYILRDPGNPERFAVSLRTNQLERMLGPGAKRPAPKLTDVVMVMRRRIESSSWSEDQWAPDTWTPDLAPFPVVLKLLRARLQEAHEYLETGTRTRHVRLAVPTGDLSDDPNTDYPVFWYRAAGRKSWYRDEYAERLTVRPNLWKWPSRKK